jgi:signal peptidase I
MEPTILPGDYFFVSKYAYGYSRFSLPFAPPIQGRLFGVAPGRGDVVVFRKPGSDVDFVKRIIGLPGETIRLSKSRLFINGVEVERTEAAPYRTNSFLGRSVEAPAYIEKLPGGPAHRIIQIEGENGLLGTTGDFVVPPWGYFLLGDNRDNSTDSRVPLEHGGVGAVPFDHLIGRVEMIYYSATPPQDGAPAQVRPERMGTAVE